MQSTDLRRSRATPSPGRTAAALVSAALYAALTACAPNDAEVAASLSANANLAGIPAVESANFGTEIWRQATGVTGSAAFTVDHVGTTFMLAVNGDAGMSVLVGDAATGALSATTNIGQGVGWPEMVGTPTDPTVAAAVPTPGGSDLTGTVSAWDAAGAQRWSRQAPDLGAAPTTNFKVDPSDGERFVIRSSTGKVGPYQDASLWLLDATTGATVWQSIEPVRWAEASQGLLMYTWRSDNDLEAPSDRVTVRSLADATELSTWNVDSDFGARSSKSTQCGGIVTPTRVVMCQWRGEERTTLLADVNGEVLVRWPSSSKPIIDESAGMVAVFGSEGNPVIAGIDAASGEQLWAYTADRIGDAQLDIRDAHDGLMLGGLGDTNVVVSSRSGAWLLGEKFEALRPGSVAVPYVIDYRDGFAVGHTGDGVGVGILPNAGDPVIFVRP